MRGCDYYARGRRVGSTRVPTRVLRHPGDSVTCVPLSPSFEHAQKGKVVASKIYTVCPGSSDPQEKITNIFVSENEVSTIY